MNVYLSELTTFINNCLKKGVFLHDLKLADITFIFKKKVSILPHLSKVHERVLYKQIDTFMKNKFSPYLYGF